MMGPTSVHGTKRAGNGFRFGRPRRISVWLALCLTITLLFTAGVHAETGSQFSLPLGNARPKNGLRLVVDARWIDANGYRPVRVQVIQWPPGPTPADRSFRLVLRPGSWYWGHENSAVVTQFLELPEGTASAETTVAIPQSSIWGSLAVEVYEGGERLEDLWETVSFNTGGGYQWSESTPAILIIDRDAPPRDRRTTLVQRAQFGGKRETPVEQNLPDIRPLIAQFPDQNQNLAPGSTWVNSGGPADDLNTLIMVQMASRMELLSPTELPERWIDFTMFDLICLSRDDLQQLIQQNETRWRAIRAWLLAGSTLCVYGAALDTEGLAELDRLLELPPPSAARATESADHWEKPKLSNRDRILRGSNPRSMDTRAYDISEGTEPTPPRKASTDSTAALFRIRQAGLGRVVAIASDEPFALPGNQLTWMFNEIRPDSWMWYQRHGLSLTRENSDYWNLIIPGVGRAPVGSYLVLITLFVIVIGPVNYVWLRKWKRLYLLLVTVPVGAALVTLALMNYALLTDGLGVRVRVRSYAHLDQRTGQAASWSRQSYYAGLAPSRGMQFPATAAFYPLEQFPIDGRAQRGGGRRLLWDEGQHLTAGYVTSRATTQMLVVQSGESTRQLVVSGGSADEPPTVENRLGTDILWLALRGEDGRSFAAGELADGQTTRLRTVDPASSSEELRRLYSVARPEFPEGYDANYYRNTFGFSRRYYYMDTDRELTPPSSNQGMLERNLRFRTNSGVDGLPRRSYLAVTRSGVEVPLGYERLREEASFHLVFGTW
ncbi:MAG: hypothetical protein KJ000_17795 [Pirellulaceae bacterium]|nr:hypothetical protein [Pirellulaceae bacterium]